MEYRIKASFYSPDTNEYSGLAGRVIDEELYNKAIEWGYSDRVEITGYVPATFRTDEELDLEIAELLAEKEKRSGTKSKAIDVKANAKEESTEVSQEVAKRGVPSNK